ncbi:MAG TPA: type II toxin-antitoxin system prevent-host-death family antitoxin [Thiotrichaceae bacterium]|jgi:prevent-host-death family protein|nr:type II toxin-antitoxin system prevent-host-death family antitoxin [Thiotrichaceae bacterium]HIM09140.1 type II toxin-antitoxin system prevent-host-death family antitoxin [Gammaproteobacteria bacterium]
MYTVSVADAKARLSELLNHVESGDEVMITRRGKLIARIVGVGKKYKPLTSLAYFRSKYPQTKVNLTSLIRKV